MNHTQSFGSLDIIFLVLSTLFQPFARIFSTNSNHSKGYFFVAEMWVMIMELYPGFSLHRGIYEFAQYAQLKGGMRWEDLNDSENGMIDVLIIMFVEWLVVLFVAYSLDGDVSLGSKESTLHDQMDSADVNQEVTFYFS